MSSLSNISRIYLLGIGGIGMSALARWFKQAGLSVAGYDRTPSALTDELVAEGIDINFVDLDEKIPFPFRQTEGTLVIRTPAVPKEHPQLLYFQQGGHMMMKRAEVLGLISQQFRTLAVAGTHGKTTTSSILAHMLHKSQLGCNAFLGGIAANYGSNLLIDKKSEFLVAEADEYDRSFLQLSPEVAIVTSTDPDHLDIYGTAEEMLNSYRAFVERIAPNGVLIRRLGLGLSHATGTNRTYSVSDASDYRAENLTVHHGLYQFDLVTPKGTFRNLGFGMPGLHNLENAIGASAAALEVGIDLDELRHALLTFCGAKRRFETIIRNQDLLFIDDYAHHPAELSACIRSVRTLNLGRHITGIFQPHLFSRTRDLAEGFAQSLAELDTLLLLDIYPARELPIPGITSQWLLNQVPMLNKRLVTKEELPNLVVLLKPDVLLTLGAGDIDRLVQPIKQALLEA